MKVKKELEVAKAGGTEQGQCEAAANRLSATDWFNKGLFSRTSGKHQEAMEAFSKAVELDSKYALAYMNRGIAYGKLGNHQQAISNYRAAARLG